MKNTDLMAERERLLLIEFSFNNGTVISNR